MLAGTQVNRLPGLSVCLRGCNSNRLFIGPGWNHSSGRVVGNPSFTGLGKSGPSAGSSRQLGLFKNRRRRPRLQKLPHRSGSLSFLFAG